jgi:hypothetical protein
MLPAVARPRHRRGGPVHLEGFPLSASAVRPAVGRTARGGCPRVTQ